MSETKKPEKLQVVKQETSGKLTITKTPWHRTRGSQRGRIGQVRGFFSHFFGGGDIFQGKKIKDNWRTNADFRENAGGALSMPRQYHPTNVGNAGRMAAVFDTVDRLLGAPGKILMKGGKILKTIGFCYNVVMFPARLASYTGKKISEATARHYMNKKLKEDNGIGKGEGYGTLTNKVKEYNKLKDRLSKITQRLGQIERVLKKSGDKKTRLETRLEEEKKKLEEQQRTIEAKAKSSFAEIEALGSKWSDALEPQRILPSKKSPTERHPTERCK